MSVAKEKIVFQGGSGIVFRGSGMFYYKYDKSEKFFTTLSFMDYWKVKRQLDVGVLANIRDMNGKLVRRERVGFEHGVVVNYRPEVEGLPRFEGSVEIEVFSSKDIVIPYSAFMAVYETRETITQVHSYTRCFSQHELEDGRAKPVAKESCWTIRDDPNVRSFAIFHNGPRATQEQQMRLKVTNSNGKSLQKEISLSSMNPYQTVKVIPANVFENLVGFLCGEPGNASIEVELGDSFSRMLVGNETKDGRQLQVTHSNFNYNELDPTHLSDSDCGYMYVPSLGLRDKEVVVYGERDPGEYRIRGPQVDLEFSGQSSVWVKFDDGMLVFSKTNGEFPARIVTGITWSGDKKSRLPFECSLGVIQKQQIPKRLWWGMVACDEGRDSKLVMHDLPDVYGGVKFGSIIVISLYGARELIPLTIEYRIDDLADLERFEQGVELNELFPEAKSYLAGDFGYYTAYCEYPGLTWYSLIRTSSGSMTLEHGF